MNSKNPNPYSNYGYTTQQGGVPQYAQTQQSGQQPNFGTYPQQQMPQSMQQMPQQPMQTYMGGPLEASGGPLIPTSMGQFDPATNKVVLGANPSATSQFSPASNKVVLGANPAANVPGMLEIQHAYLENIIRLNKGNLATVHLTFSAHSANPNMTVRGNIIASGRDHIILLDPETNTYYVLLMVYIDYITFNEPIQTS
ncbi:spore coat protein GerQ [Bacillus sp. AGMB 02131]|uniref:Spore coat protein GerQ n=2 Tax=Peribacillus faecalis TaxID=2772559 RepID=A0A927HA09_9BACI|nr:spore coat protein GerQ [Peribacillus faecalis]